MGYLVSSILIVLLNTIKIAVLCQQHQISIHHLQSFLEEEKNLLIKNLQLRSYKWVIFYLRKYIFLV